MKEYRGQFPEPWAYKGDHYASQPEPRTALAAMITRMDRDVGRILGLLKKLGLDRDTLVLFTSDNGGYLMGTELFRNNGPLRGGKGSFYEGGIRVPLLARWPGRVLAGATDDLVWAFWDVLPTLAELAGAKPPRTSTACPWPSGCWAKNKHRRNGFCIGKPSRKTKAASRRGPSQPAVANGRRSAESLSCRSNSTTSAATSAKRAMWRKPIQRS